MIRNTSGLQTLLGINNILGDRSMEVFREGRPAGRFLRNAVNVDIDNDGVITRRRGYALVSALSGATHIWGNNDSAYVTANKTLYTFDGTSTTAIGSVTSDTPCFCETPIGTVVADNTNLRYINSGALLPFNLPTPSPVPTTTVSGGALPAGKYLVAFANTSGMFLSGTSDPIQIELPPDSGLSFSLPASSYAINVYVSHPNGETLYRRFTIPAGATSASYLSSQVCFEAATTLFKAPLPPGTYMAMHGSRLLSARSNTLFFSDPFSYGLYDRRSGYIPFEHPITMILSHGEAVYIGTTKSLIRLEGQDIVGARYNELRKEGVLPGSLQLDDEGDMALFVLNGETVMSVTQSGEIALFDEAVTLPQADRAVSTVYDYNGMTQYAVDLIRPDVNRASASSYMEAEVVRRGNLTNQDLVGE